MGRVSPNYIVQDGVIPRTKLPTVLAQMQRMSEATGLRVANVFHAGDGNLHPMVLYNGAIAGEEARALEFSYEILRMCVDAGGSITGEHGVGREKQCEMSYMFAEPDLATMQRVRRAFDPNNIANPDKLFPTPASAANEPTEPTSRTPSKPPASRRFSENERPYLHSSAQNIITESNGLVTRRTRVHRRSLCSPARMH